MYHDAYFKKLQSIYKVNTRNIFYKHKHIAHLHIILSPHHDAPDLTDIPALLDENSVFSHERASYCALHPRNTTMPALQTPAGNRGRGGTEAVDNSQKKGPAPGPCGEYLPGAPPYLIKGDQAGSEPKAGVGTMRSLYPVRSIV